MPSIQDMVNDIPLKDLQPAKPEEVAAPEVDVSVEKVKAVVERLVKPWRYGNNLCRFGRVIGVPLREVRRIKEALDARLKAEAAKKKEPVEEPAQGSKGQGAEQ